MGLKSVLEQLSTDLCFIDTLLVSKIEEYKPVHLTTMKPTI